MKGKGDLVMSERELKGQSLKREEKLYIVVRGDGERAV